ncbi:hypothetical protein [Thermoactinospora rubra]|uniref:hypothetical protein n=1 Tax=Thermoactinospora rubra TaxID=1088767 RepID=UPI001981AEE2|nr:hypothetical protein [Thermoactinospora rubra]
MTLSVRELAARLAELAGAPTPRLEQMTERDLALLGLTAPFWLEFHEVLHTPGHPYLVDSSETEEVFGIAPTPVEEVLKEVIAASAAR